MATTWAEVAAGLTPERISALTRQDLPAGYQFSDQREVFEDIARDASAAAYMSTARLWDAVGINQNNGEQQADAVDVLLNRIERFEVSPDSGLNPNEEREAILAELRAQRMWLIKNARPYRSPDAASGVDELQRVHAVRAQVEALKVEAETALEAIRSRAAGTGAVSAAKLYKDRAVDEDAAARNATIGLVASGVVFVITALLFFEWWAPDPDAKVGEAIAAVAGRTLSLGTVAYGITFFARNFRAHRHLATVNRFKANALEAAPLLREGIATDEDRDVIIGELVRSVFAVPDTGFIGGNESLTIQTPVSSMFGPQRPS